MKKQKENSHEGITWSEMGKQNVQAEKVYSHENSFALFARFFSCLYGSLSFSFSPRREMTSFSCIVDKFLSFQSSTLRTAYTNLIPE